MKIKEVSAGVKIVKDYNSYSVNLVADVDEAERAENVGEELISRAEEIIKNKIGDEDVEVGAAWPHKKSANFLSVKMNDDVEYRDVRIADLEKTDDGYRDGDLIYKQVKKRKNDKMPIYRIYKIRGEFGEK